MVKFALFIGADLRGLTDLQPSGGCDDPDFSYFLKVRCESCGEKRVKDICVRLGAMVRLKPRTVHPTELLTTNLERRTAHVQLKCKLCDRESHIKMIPGYGEPLTLKKSQNGEKTCLMVFDCSGVVPVGFSFADGWVASSVDGYVFNLNLSKEFVRHDKQGLASALILRLHSSFEEVKEGPKGHVGKIIGHPKLVSLVSQS